MGVVLHLFRFTWPDPSKSNIYYPILGILMWPIGSMVKHVWLAHVHGFDSRPRIFFLGQCWHAIQLKYNISKTHHFNINSPIGIL